jgi:hypothetical protein
VRTHKKSTVQIFLPAPAYPHTQNNEFGLHEQNKDVVEKYFMDRKRFSEVVWTDWSKLKEMP